LLHGPTFLTPNTYVPCFIIYILQPKNFSDLHFILLPVRTQQGFENIVINKWKKKVFSTVRYLSLFPFLFSHPLWLSGFILSRPSMMGGCRVCRLTYLHLHLYLHMTNPTNRYTFPYLGNFMAAFTGSTHTNQPFVLPARYHFLDIYLLPFLWYPVPELVGWHVFISIYILTWRIQPTTVPFPTWPILWLSLRGRRLRTHLLIVLVYTSCTQNICDLQFHHGFLMYINFVQSICCCFPSPTTLPPSWYTSIMLLLVTSGHSGMKDTSVICNLCLNWWELSRGSKFHT